MKIVHRFVDIFSDPEKAASVNTRLRAFGIESLGELSDSIFILHVSEDEPGFSEATALLRSLDASESVDTVFSPAELRAADYLMISEPAWMNGYPESSDDFGYLESTYDLSDYCDDCGVGAVQRAPFRLKKRPKWGRRSIFRLNWVTGEYFVPPELWKRAFQPMGIEAREVLLHRSGEIIDNVVQLDVPKRAHLDLDDARLRDVKHTTCRKCGRPKVYGFFYVGHPPRPATNVDAAIFKSFEYFGAGGEAGNAVYISQELYSKIAGIRGVTFRPVLPRLQSNGRPSSP